MSLRDRPPASWVIVSLETGKGAGVIFPVAPALTFSI